VTSRRDFLHQTFAGATVALAPISLKAAPISIFESITNIFGSNKHIEENRVKLKLPPLTENGNSVTMSVEVTSPMTSNDFVESIHIFSEVNPLPNIATFYLTPATGTARVVTRIRLADSQTLVAVAAMNDGSLWSGSSETIVTLAACLDGT
jgi:sulfur-oxidizing protein SoxY